MHNLDARMTELARRELARKDLLGFAQYMAPHVLGSRVYNVNWHHRVIADTMMKLASGEIKKAIITTPPRVGKALGLDTPVLTTAGWSSMGALRVGDKVFGSDGRPTRVVAVSPVWHDRPCYHVSFGNEEIVADEEHEWTTTTGETLTTKELATYCGVRKYYQAHKRAAQAPPLQYPEIPPFLRPIDPYILGVWLGDGDTGAGRITAHEDDAPFYRAEFERLGVPTTDRKDPQAFGTRGLVTQLRSLGVLGNKHIPVQYLHAPEEARRALLQGLIDTDGHVKPSGQAEFYQKDPVLARQVHQLVTSLGVKAQLSAKPTKEYGVHWRVNFYLKDCARLPRKRVHTRDASRCQDHALIAQKAERTADTVCIEVEAEDHLFLVGRSLVPTHNSALAYGFFVPWFMGNNPGAEVMVASHTSALAEQLAGQMQASIKHPLYAELFPEFAYGDTRQKKYFTTTAHGKFRAVGTDQGTAGYGGDVLLIDDYFKNRAAAESPAQRETLWQWYLDDFQSRRLGGNAGMLVMATRWHEDDLIGRLLSRPGAEEWTVIHLPAIAEKTPGCPDDPRAPGEILWPELWAAGPKKADYETLIGVPRKTIISRAQAFLDGVRRDGEYGFSALYQGRPTPKFGGLVQRDWIKTYSGDPKALRQHCSVVVLSIDTALGKTKRADECALMVMGYHDSSGKMLILDDVHQQLAYPELRNKIRELSLRWGNPTILIEKNALGQAIWEELQRSYPMIRFNPGQTPKAARAQQAADMIQADKILFPTINYVHTAEAVIEDIVGFGTRASDHRMDALSQVCIHYSRLLSAATAQNLDSISDNIDQAVSGFLSQMDPFELLDLF